MKPDSLLPPIMVVDDSPDDVFLLGRCLKSAGIKNTVLHFGTGGEAFLFLKQFCPPSTTRAQLPCVMFLDINMQGLSGFDILLWARKQPALQDMKIFVLSGAGEEFDAQIAAKLGADRYLEKFPEPAAFKEMMADVGAMPRR